MGHMKCISAILLVMALGAQLKVNNDAALSDDQRTVIPLLEPIEAAVLKDDADSLVDMFESAGGRLTVPQERGIATFNTRIQNRADIYSCVVFDTICARDFFSTLSERLIKEGDRAKGNAALEVSRVFISVKEFLEKHKNEMQVTFQPQPQDSVQAELHIPRRPDADQVPPPFGEYESITVGFVKTSSGWRIDKLFPEPYQYLNLFF
jgi:hypothetical protein